MGENTAIEWAHHTFNPWVGCTKVGPPCDHCYAEAWAKRTGHPELWDGDRRRTSATNWQQPLKWDRAAATAGERHRVFCASLADVFDNQVNPAWRWDLWHRIEQTPHLDWLLLTKRPQNIRKMLPDPETGVKPWGDGWPNVWLGTTCGDQKEYDRNYDVLRKVRAVVRFISYEPALGPLLPDWDLHEGDQPDWIIAGGESGSKKSRPPHPRWFLDLQYDCARRGIAFLFKQWGDWRPATEAESRTYPRGNMALVDRVVGRDAAAMIRVGKKAAGRLLDGRTWDEFPTPRTVEARAA